MRRLIWPVAALIALALTPASAGAVTFKEFDVTTVSAPTGVVQGPDGFMYVTENLGGAIDRMNPTTGAFTRTLLPASPANPFQVTNGPDGNLWASDEGGAIWRIAPAGGVPTRFVPPTTGGTHGITLGPDGALWYTMRNAGIVGRLATDGTFTEFPLSTTAAGPERIVPGPDGNLWFTESVTNQIARITTTGAITEFPVPTAGADVKGIAPGPDGNLWFTERNGSRIGRITTTGTITEFELSPSAQPVGIVAGPDGAMWFTDELRDRIGRITTDGHITFYATPSPASPGTIATGPNSTLWYTAGADTVGRVETLPAPVVGKTVNAEPVQGTVLVRSPKGKTFVKLGGDGKQIPTGSEIDTRKGTVSLTAAKGTATQGTATSEFFDGVFTVTQARAPNAITEAKLTGKLEGCSTKRGARSAAKRKGRRLWGRGKGRFRTRGRRSSTTVRGTTWLVEDRCDGSTVTTVKEGSVEVQAGKRKVIVNAPGSFVAKR